MVMATNEKMLSELSEDMDKKILEWLQTYEIPPLNLIAVMLARLTWLAKLSDVKEDFVQLLKAPELAFDSEEKTKDIIH